MITQVEITQRNHRKAVRFFWFLLGGATLASLVGNIAHAVLPYLPVLVVQIGAAAVPPIVLLAAVHGVALAVQAGASGAVYRWSVAAVALIGLGAFALSFIALQGLMLAIGYSPVTAWIFPAIIDAAVAVATLMLVALGDKPARRPRTASRRAVAHATDTAGKASAPARSRTADASPTSSAPAARPQPAGPCALQAIPANSADLDTTAIARTLVDTGATTKSLEQVEQVLAAHAAGTAITRIAADIGVHHATVRKIVNAAAQHQQFAAAG